MRGRVGPMLLCIGDIDMDIVIKVDRPPGRDEKVDGRAVAQTPGGMAANVAVGAQRLGTPTRILGAVGQDAMGREAFEALRAEGLDVHHVVQRAGVPTFFCLILVDDTGEKSLVKVVSDAYLPRPDDLSPAAFEGVAHVHLTFTEPVLATRALDLGKQVGATVSLDLEAADLRPDGRTIERLLDTVDIIFISQQSRAEIEQRLHPIVPGPGATLVTTLGADGVRLERDGRVVEVAGHAVPVTDTSGAGDAFAAAFLHARLGGAGDYDALRFANAAAALSTSAYGAQAGLPTLAQVRTFLEHQGQEPGDD